MEPLTTTGIVILALTGILSKIGEGSLARIGEILIDRVGEKGTKVLKLLKYKSKRAKLAIEQAQQSPEDIEQAFLIEEEIDNIAKVEPEFYEAIQQLEATVQKSPEIVGAIQATANYLKTRFRNTQEIANYAETMSITNQGGFVNSQTINQDFRLQSSDKREVNFSLDKWEFSFDDFVRHLEYKTVALDEYLEDLSISDANDFCFLLSACFDNRKQIDFTDFELEILRLAINFCCYKDGEPFDKELIQIAKKNKYYSYIKKLIISSGENLKRRKRKLSSLIKDTQMSKIISEIE